MKIVGPQTYLPGRRSAGSSKSGRLVAPMTKTSAPWLDADIPSNSANIWLTIRSMTPPESPWFPRFGAMESNSSKKMTQGLASRARWKIRRTFASDSPMYILSNSGPLTERKLREHDVATAFANSVLPVPGGPYSRMPRVKPFESESTIIDIMSDLNVALDPLRIILDDPEVIVSCQVCLPLR